MNQLVKQVNFQDILMTACKTNNNKIFVSIKSICEGLGIDANGQMQRINRDDVLPEGMCKIHVPTLSGEQEINMLNIEYLPFFLVGIKSSMCREEIQPKLKDFKLKAKDVLAEAFTNKPKCIEDVLIKSLEEIKQTRIAVEKAKVDADEAKRIAKEVSKNNETINHRINNLDCTNIQGTPRQRLNSMVKKYSFDKGITVPTAWKEFRKSFNTAYHTNIEQRKTNYLTKNKIKSLSFPEYLEKVGLIEDSLRVADKMLNA